MFQGLLDRFRGLLRSLGLLRKDAKILFLGLDNAGKSTLLHMLKTDSLTVCSPTLYPHMEELLIGKIRFQTWDLGGHETARRLWQDYYATVDGIVFIVDAADRTRFAEVSEELQKLFEAEGLAHVPIVILGNKIDIPVAASEDELRLRIGLPHHLTIGQDAKKGACSVRPVELFMVSIKRRMGYDAAFRWLSEFL